MTPEISAALSPQSGTLGHQLRLQGDDSDLPDTFRRLYYHLYSNGNNVSRAERIMDDVSLILLYKLVSEQSNDAKATLARYRQLQGTANDTLLPVLRVRLPQLVGTHQEFHLEDEQLRWAFDELQNVRLMSAPAHVLGDAFQALIGPGLRGDKGQFFTPKSLVSAMVQVLAPQPGESILDPACGTGGFLTEAHNYQNNLADGTVDLGLMVGVDKDYDLARFSGSILQVVTAGRAVVYHCNALSLQDWHALIQPNDIDLFDVVLTNPPFGARISIRDKSILEQFDLGHRWSKSRQGGIWVQNSEVANSQHPQLLFLELCVNKLKPGGRLGIVLPEGVFGNKGQGYVWHWLRERGYIFALLDCPRTTFQPSTDTKTNVLFFGKADNPETHSVEEGYSVRVGVAINCGHDRRGRSRLGDGTARPDDFSHLGASYHDHSDDSGWHDVLITNPEYLVPRYYVNGHTWSAQEKELIGNAEILSLGDLVSANLLAITKGHEPGSDSYGTGDIPFIRTSDITNFELSANPTNGLSEDIYFELAQYQNLKPGDVIMAVDGRYRIGTTALITENNYRCVVQSHFRILSTLDPCSLSCYELLFALNLPSVRSRIRNLVFVQSTLGTLGKRLLELRIPILSGDGPWRQRVERFRDVLLQRDALLAELSNARNNEPEL